MKKKTLQISPPLATPSEEIDMQGFLLLRGKTYCFRRKIPADIRQYFPAGSKEIWRSLSTTDKRHANSLCRDWVAKTERVFAMLKTTIPDEMKIEYVKSEIQPSSSAVLTASPAPEKGLTINELILSYVSHKSAIWSLKSKQEVEYSLNLFPALCGNLRLPKIDYKVVEGYRDKLQELPANYTRLKKYKSKTIDELLALPANEKDAPDPRSINKHLGFLSTLLKFGVQRKHLLYNPAEGIKVKAADVVVASAERDKYTKQDLQDIVWLLQYEEEHPERFYVPLISMFTGMRRGEICQLYVSDIIFDVETSLPCIDINARCDMVDYVSKGKTVQLPEKKLKQTASWRIVPVHPVLWDDLGFGGFVEMCRRRGQKRIFQELAFHRDGFGTNFSKWYDTLAVKIADKNSGKSFHSFRHSFADYFKQNQVQGYDRGMANEIVKEFIGHAYSKSGSEDLTLERYGKKYPVKTGASVLFQLDYDLNFDNVTEQVGHLISIGNTVQKKIALNPNLDHPTEVESP